MLVLSRGERESISFPELDIAIEILKVSGKKVQIGIKASDEIRVLRTELMNRASSIPNDLDASSRHAIRNRLNSIGLAMAIAQKHLEHGDLCKAELALQNVAKAPDAVRTPRDSASHSSHVLEQAKWISVLLVEDNLNESNLLSDILEMNGVHVRIAHNGIEALEALDARIPDAVLLDMHMPLCDGPSAIEQIRRDQRFRSMPIYAVTGVSKQDSFVQLSVAEEVDNWFQKPVKSQMLLDALRALPARALAC
jgi:carbon storage regulator CsrA